MLCTVGAMLSTAPSSIPYVVTAGGAVGAHRRHPPPAGGGDLEQGETAGLGRIQPFQQHEDSVGCTGLAQLGRASAQPTLFFVF